MSELGPLKPPIWFWIVSVLGLVWNAVGVLAFVSEMKMDLAALPDAQRLFFETRPTWATAGYAVAVFGGALGCLALMLRKSWAVPMLMLSLLGIVVQVFHSLGLGNGLEIFGPEDFVLPAMVLVIACLLIWFARGARARGWIR